MQQSPRCYLCGSPDRLTRDHVPPKGFFPPPLPSNLITVPCCLECNNSNSKDDEAARLWFSCHLGSSSAAQWIFENKVLKNTVVRAPSLRESLLRTMKDVILNTVDGDLPITQYEIPSDRVTRFVVRITKGLITNYYPTYAHNEAHFEVRHIQTTVDKLKQLEQVRNLLKYDVRGDGVFQFRHGLTESGKSGLWILVFYEALMFLVSHSQNDWGKKPS